MKKISLIISCLSLSVLANAQSPSFEWAKNIGGHYGYANGLAVKVISNTVYMCGKFKGRVDFNPGAGIFYLTSAGNEDIFISKSDTSGNLLWAKSIGGPTNDIAYSIVVDASGNVYTTGSFSQAADFDPGPGVFNLTASGATDIFISKLDASGNFIWAKQMGGTGADIGRSIDLDASGNVFTTGSFSLTADFDPGIGTYNLIVNGSYADIFISKLNPSGNFLSAIQFGHGEGNSIKIDGAGNILTTGYFTGTADFDPGAATYNLISISGFQNVFISKLNASGNFVWAKQMGGYIAYGNSITVDGSGNVYSTGIFYGTNDFDPGPDTSNLTPTDGFDIYISKLSASGNFGWVKHLEGSEGDEAGPSIAYYGGYIYTTGSYRGMSDFDPGPGTFYLTYVGSGSSFKEIFISKLDINGNFVWAKQLGGASYDNGYSISVDGPGNVYTCGMFTETGDFDPGAGTYNLGEFGQVGSLYISKLNSSGDFVWAKNAGTGAAIMVNSMEADVSGNVYTTGYFFGIVDFDPGPAIYNLTSANSNDIFISKTDASGNFVWAKQLGGSSDDHANSIAVDASGNVYTTGDFTATVDFDPGPGTFNLNYGGGSVFISKLNASGNFVWAKQLGLSQNSSVNSIAVDATGNVYTTGKFEGNGDFDPGAGTFYLNAGSPFNYDIFISRLDANGNFVWAKRLGGSSHDYGNSIALDASGNVYTTGTFEDTADFDPGPGVFNLTAVAYNDVFISKLDASGNFVWAKQLGGTIGDWAVGIAVDASANVYTTGFYYGTLDFDPGPGTFNLTASNHDVFISKLDVSGNFVWGKQLGGPGVCISASVAVDGSGSVYTTGRFDNIIDFDPGTGTYNLQTVPNNSDVFISKLNSSGNFVWAKQLSGTYDLTAENGIAIAIDGNSDVYTAGFFYETVDFNPDAGTSYLTSYGYPDLFIHKMSQCTFPSAAITPAGPTTFCSGGSVVLNAPAGANKIYQWKKGANLITGATLSSYTATTGGNYRVIVTNTVTGCSKTSGSATVVTVNPLPAATITPQGPTTFCAGGSVVLAANTGAGLTYKWKKGSSYISGATLLNYTATIGGNYRVQVTNSNGCSKTSALVAVSVPCREGESVNVGEGESEFEMKVFPNPNSGEFTIKFSNKPISSIQIELTDEIGKVVKELETNDETVVIKESNLAKGIYSLAARNKNKVVIKKITIVK